MTTRSGTRYLVVAQYLVVALASLASLTACGGRPSSTTAAATVPVAATGSVETPAPPAVPVDLTGANAPGTGAARSAGLDVPGVEVPSAKQPVREPGDVNGQGINGTWFAVSPAGGRTKAMPGFP